MPWAADRPLHPANNLHWTAVIEAIVLGDGGLRHQATLKALLYADASTQLTDRSGATPVQLAQARDATMRGRRDGLERVCQRMMGGDAARSLSTAPQVR